MIDVALTPADLTPAPVAVVIDALRATSTATWALAAGYERVLLTDTVERALTLRGPGRVLAGERGCVRPPQFDQGN
ncbi:MAG TPA: 2-phosphosulfolactate phosphatase, partial [Solirubrobacteraceae bacterium]|nr:2-phosphosulfolactate phosphatase [Solirubrobacteraceae bacterium]